MCSQARELQAEFYSRKDLAAWMKKVFAPEIESETAKLEHYQKMPTPELSRPAASSAAPRERSATPFWDPIRASPLRQREAPSPGLPRVKKAIPPAD